MRWLTGDVVLTTGRGAGLSKGYPSAPFDRAAGAYDRAVFAASDFPHAGYQAVLDEVVRNSAPCPEMTVLDLGVGTGNLAKLFLARDCKVWGLDFSTKMLENARDKLPSAVLLYADLVGEWPKEVRRRYDRVISSYALHHFDLATKARLIRRVVRDHLGDKGRVVIGDIAFPTAAAREEARPLCKKHWEDDEHYWAADETMAAFKEVHLHVRYTQVSSCGGVFVIEPI